MSDRLEHVVVIRLPSNVGAFVEAEARRRGLTLSRYLRLVLAHAFETGGVFSPGEDAAARSKAKEAA